MKRFEKRLNTVAVKFGLVVLLLLGISMNSCNNQKNEAEIIDLVSFEEFIGDDKLTMVDFYATWCGPCMQMDPFVKEIKAEKKDIVNVVQVDTDKSTDIAEKYQIDALPTLIFFKNGKVVHRDVGGRSKEDLLKLIEQFR
jgi:thioredoxin 1